MNKINIYFILLIASVSLFSCHKDDAIAPPRDRGLQYTADIDSIENYLKHHYITTVMVNGEVDVVIDSILPGGTQTPIWTNTDYPLQYKMVNDDSRTTNNVDGGSTDKTLYKMYYLTINKGAKDTPTSVDSTFTSYKGWTLDDKVFDARDTPLWSTFPVNPTIGETSLISGYRQFLPELKTATGSSVGDDGSLTSTNAGLGIVFIPSGLGYYDKVTATVGAYSPLVFKIRLHSLRYRDHDRDGVLSKDEYVVKNSGAINPAVNNEFDFFNYDTDGDNIPNFLDMDDDGDGYSTIFEIQVNGLTVFPYPTCDSGIPKYLDKSCHPPKKAN